MTLTELLYYVLPVFVLSCLICYTILLYYIIYYAETLALSTGAVPYSQPSGIHISYTNTQIIYDTIYMLQYML